jgi:hypothetical protein
LGTDAVDVVVKATVARAGQIAAATENSIAEPAPSTAETSAGRGRRLSPGQLERALTPFKPFRGLAAYYLAVHWRLRRSVERTPG